MALHTFQQHTEVGWLSLGSAIKRLLQQWDPICQLVRNVGQDEKQAARSINNKRAAAVLISSSNDTSKLMYEINIVPVFEDFLVLPSDSCSV